MHIGKREGSILISVVLIMFLMSSLGLFCFKLILYNIQIENLCIFNNDKYNIEKNEEDVLYKFMSDLNDDLKKTSENDSISTTPASVIVNDKTNMDEEKIGINKKEEHEEIIDFDINSTTQANVKVKEEKSLNINNSKVEKIFNDSFQKKLDNNKLVYDKDKKELLMYFDNGNSLYKIRKLDYKIKDNRIILIPTISVMYSDE